MSKEQKIKWLVIVNPAASGGQGEQRWSVIQAYLHKSGIDFFYKKTTHRNHATHLAQEAIEAGCRHLIAVGGDGTGNEVVNGIFQQKKVKSTAITFALLPLGTGNDWIKTHQIPKDLVLWVDCLKKGKTTIQDVGLVTCFFDGKKIQRYFINVAGMAYDAYTVQMTEQKSSFVFPKIQYLLAVLKGLFKYRLHRAKLIFNEEEIIDFFYTINVGICKYSGGGMQLVPHAIPDDGQLALTYAGNISKLNIILNTYRFYNGSLLSHPKVNGVFSKKIKVETMDNQPTGVEVDGEYIGETPVVFEIIPQALRLIIAD